MPTVAASVDLVVHLALDPHGGRRVEEIVAVPGRVEGDVIETAVVFERAGGELHRGAGLPPRPERYARVGVDVRALLAGCR